MTSKEKRMEALTGSVGYLPAANGEDLDYTMVFGHPQILSSIMFVSTSGFTGYISHNVYDKTTGKSALINNCLTTGNSYFYYPTTRLYYHRDIQDKIRVSGSQTGTWYFKAGAIGG